MCTYFKPEAGVAQNQIDNFFSNLDKFFAILKMRKIIPVYKKRCKTEVTTYRPISLLSNISKIIEKVVHDRVYMFLEQKKMLFMIINSESEIIFQQIML